MEGGREGSYKGVVLRRVSVYFKNFWCSDSCIRVHSNFS